MSLPKKKILIALACFAVTIVILLLTFKQASVKRQVFLDDGFLYLSELIDQNVFPLLGYLAGNDNTVFQKTMQTISFAPSTISIMYIKPPALLVRA